MKYKIHVFSGICVFPIRDPNICIAAVDCCNSSFGVVRSEAPEYDDEKLANFGRIERDWVLALSHGISALATAITYLFVEARIADADSKEFNVSLTIVCLPPPTAQHFVVCLSFMCVEILFLKKKQCYAVDLATIKKC